MFSLLPKSKSKIKSGKSKCTEEIKQKVPEKWEDFARLCKIRSGNRVVSFEAYDYQILLSNLIDTHYGCVITKSRQLGVTEAISCKFLHKACLSEGYLAVILSKSQVDTMNIARRIRRMTDGLSDYINLLTDSLTDLQIKGGGRIVFRNSKANGTRGLESVSDILLDECAFVDDAERIYSAVMPSTEMVGDDARIVILSTPGGKNGFYWDRLNEGNPPDKNIEDICSLIRNKEINPVQAWTDNNGWGKLVLHWLAHPTYSNIPDYLEQIKTKKQLSSAVVEQEYNLSFSESEVNVFPSELIKACANGLYKEAQSWSTYYVGIDTALLGEDYTVGIVVKYSSSWLFVEAIYRERKKSIEYNLAHLGNLISMYNPCKVGVETTGGSGLVYLEQLAKQHSSIEFEAIKTTSDSKVSMIDRLLLCMEKREIFYPPECPIVEELSNFRRSGKKLGAPSGKHDDCVMSLCFAVAVSPVNQKGVDNSWLYNL